MHFQIEVRPPTPQSPLPHPAPATGDAAAELLRQLVDIQKQQLDLARSQAASHDSAARWRSFIARWDLEFPGVARNCKSVLPRLERTYLRLIDDLTQRFTGDDPEELDNEYVLFEFLDRYGQRLSQLGTILNLIGPLAEAAPHDESPN